jgi:hypothetical protein
VRLLTLKIQEPLPGLVLPQMIADHGAEEAARRYRAVVITSLRQLSHLTDTRLRLFVEPADAHEAVRFWILPRLADRWQAEGLVYRASGWEIDFGEADEKFTIHAFGEILCPFLGARWVHAAMLGIGKSVSRVIGPSSCGGEYFTAHAPANPLEGLPHILPELSIIQTHDHWQEALDSPLGPALKRAWEEEA